MALVTSSETMSWTSNTACSAPHEPSVWSTNRLATETHPGSNVLSSWKPTPRSRPGDRPSARAADSHAGGRGPLVVCGPASKVVMRAPDARSGVQDHLYGATPVMQGSFVIYGCRSHLHVQMNRER